MRAIQATLGVLITTVLLAGCTTVQERQALSNWQVEAQTLHVDENEDGHLPELGETSNLDDYILYALLNNPGLRASFDRWKAALEKVTPARTLPDPRFTYAYYIQEIETRVGSQKQKFSLAQTFPWFGKLDLQGEMALQDANAEQQRYEAEKLNLIYQVKKIYYEYWYLARSIDITRNNITLVSNFEGVARAKYRSGAGLQSAVVKTQVELGKLADRLRSKEDLVRPVVAKMNAVLNRPAQLPLPMPKILPQEKHDISDEDLKALLMEHNPALKAIDYMTAKEDLAVELAGKNFFPDMTLGVDFIDTEAYSDINPEDNGKDPVIAMVSVNLPIWFQKYNAMTDEARLRKRALLRQRKEKENALSADLEMALYELRDADRKVELYKNTLLPMAEQNVKVNQLAFSSDKIGFLDLIDSQRILLEFQLDHQRALSDRGQRVAEIEMLTGGTP